MALVSGSALCFFAFVACRRQYSHEVVSCTDCGLHTADFAATGILLLQNCSRPRLSAYNWLSYTQRTGTTATTAAATATAATATTIEELRSELLLRFGLCGLAAVEGEDTRLH